MKGETMTSIYYDPEFFFRWRRIFKQTNNYFKSIDTKRVWNGTSFVGDKYIISVEKYAINIWSLRDPKTFEEKEKMEIADFLNFFFKERKGWTLNTSIDSDLIETIKEIKSIHVINSSVTPTKNSEKLLNCKKFLETLEENDENKENIEYLKSVINNMLGNHST
jgi:hypothetical protein